MLKLSERLQLIADQIKKGETVADIGTDHGFLPIFLWESGISPRVIMTDVSPGSLKKAAENCNRLYPDTVFDLRLGSGIKVLENEETDCLVIAGMGGILMTEILGDDIKKTKSFRKIILQPRNNIGMLRYWLCNNGFYICNEQLVKEKKYICEVLNVMPKEMAVARNLGPDRIEYEYPHTLIKFAGPLTREYLYNKLNIEKEILRGMEASKSVTYEQIRSRRYRIEYIGRLIEKL